MPRVFVRVRAPHMTMRLELSSNRCLTEAKATFQRMTMAGIADAEIAIALDADGDRWHFGNVPEKGWDPQSL